jgi:hypothetical protein
MRRLVPIIAILILLVGCQSNPPKGEVNRTGFIAEKKIADSIPNPNPSPFQTPAQNPQESQTQNSEVVSTESGSVAGNSDVTKEELLKSFCDLKKRAYIGTSYGEQIGAKSVDMTELRGMKVCHVHMDNVKDGNGAITDQYFFDVSETEKHWDLLKIYSDQQGRTTRTKFTIELERDVDGDNSKCISFSCSGEKEVCDPAKLAWGDGC